MRLPAVHPRASPWTFYLGYGFANSGRDADVLTLEVGVTF